MYTTDQQTYIDELDNRAYGDPMDLLDYADGERVDADTFNQRQSLYKGLFSRLDDGRRNIDVALVASNRELYADRFVIEAFDGPVNVVTRRIALTGGAAYQLGRRVSWIGWEEEFGVVNQYLVVDVTGELAVRDKAGYLHPATELVVGEWDYDSLSYTPADPTIRVATRTVFEAGVAFGGLAEFASDVHILGMLNVEGTSTFNSDVVVNGQLFISNGQVTQIETQQLLIGDNLITLNSDLPALNPPTEDAGVEINRGNQATASFMWMEGLDRWRASHGMGVAGDFWVEGDNLVFTGADPAIVADASDLSIRAAASSALYLQRENAATAGSVDLFNGMVVVSRDGALTAQGELTLQGATPGLVWEDTDSVASTRKVRARLQDNLLQLIDATGVPAVRATFDMATGGLTLDGALTVRSGIVQDDTGEDDFTVTSRHGLIINLDANNNGIAEFAVNNGVGTRIFTLKEDGTLEVLGSHKFSGSMFAQSPLTVRDWASNAQEIHAKGLRLGGSLTSLVDPGAGGLSLGLAADAGLVIDAAAGQTRNPIHLRDSGGDDLFYVTPDGLMFARSLSASGSGGDLYLTSNRAVVIDLDDDELITPDTARFIVRNGGDVDVFFVTEQGDAEMAGKGTFGDGLDVTGPAILRGLADHLQLVESDNADFTWTIGLVGGALHLRSEGDTVAVLDTLGMTLYGGLTHAGNVVNGQDHFVGRNLTNHYLHFVGSDTRLHTQRHAIVMLDADDTGTDGRFAIRKDGVDSFDLFAVYENGDTFVAGDIVIDGETTLAGDVHLGDAGTDVAYLKAIVAAIDTRSTVVAKDPQGRIATATVSDGVTQVRQRTYTYGPLNRVATRVTTIGGRTITESFSYDVNGELIGCDKNVA